MADSPADSSSVLSVAAMLLVATAWVSVLEQRMKVTARFEKVHFRPVVDGFFEERDLNCMACCNAHSHLAHSSLLD